MGMPVDQMLVDSHNFIPDSPGFTGAGQFSGLSIRWYSFSAGDPTPSQHALMPHFTRTALMGASQCEATAVRSGPLPAPEHTRKIATLPTN